MRKNLLISIIGLSFLMLAFVSPADSCSSFIVTKGASADGSVMITYTCDGEFHPHLEYEPPADYQAGDSLEILNWPDNSLRGKVQQVVHTYGVVNLINEHQLVIGETTFEGREELRNKEGLLDYWDLIELALARAKTAREAVEVMTALVDEYGYSSTGESFSIADPNEVWMMEMIGPGPGGHGALWVALRIPDGYICCHANQARIGEFPLDDPDNCLYAENVISFAVEKGYYDPGSGKPFRFCDAYCPANIETKRSCAGRVWSMFRRCAPSLNLSSDYCRGVEGAEPYPLWLKADKKLSLADVIDIMRDHYEGTPFDMTKGIDAGDFGSPYRWRPLRWEIDSFRYTWERPISTQQTGFSYVAQVRSWLPDKIGGVLWYGVDDTYFTCYFPLYCGITDLPVSFTRGSLQEFSWESAWWVFNFVANYANLKYSYMIKDIQAVQRELEQTFIELQPAVEKTALELHRTNPELAVSYLTNYSVGVGEQVVRRWQQLGEDLIVKYNDGFIKDEQGEPQQVGYPESWLKEIIRAYPDKYRVGPARGEKK